MTLEPGTPIGKYVVQRKLAEGGMAEIYLCAARGPEGFEKEIVIKRIRSFVAKDPDFVKMFIAEARLASRLNHLNLVQIFDFDKHEDTYYLAMEYVRGASLSEARRKAQELMLPMSPILAAQICAEVARGLAYAHRLTDDRGRPLGLVHRDVTPQNVLLSFDGAVKLADFGIAKAGEKMTQPGMLKGKFAYMSPEQARGEDVDARTDIFALGVVLWEMLTGGRLFVGDNEMAILRAVQGSAIAPPGRLNPDVPVALDEIVMKALSRQPAQRPQSAQELERALAQFVLTHARSVDDTDIASYLRRLYPEDDGSSRETMRDLPPLELASSPAATPEPRQPTAVMRKRADDLPATRPSSKGGQASGEASVAGLSPDEDYDAPTVRTGKRTEASGVPAGAPPAAAPPPRAEAGRRSLLLVGLALLAVMGGALATFAALLPRLAAEPSASTAEPIPAGADAGEGQPSSAALEATPVDAGAPPLALGPNDAGSSQEGPAPGPPGVLVVRANPWAHLFIDGKPRGEVNDVRRRIPLKPGTYEIRFKHPRKSRTDVITIQSGRERTAEFSLHR